MSEQGPRRRLAAILAADVVGYSRLIEQDERETFEQFRAHRQEVFEPEVGRHSGRIFKLTGDGFLAEFASVVDAVECAVALQRKMAARNVDAADGRRMDFRLAVNLGDVIVEGDDRLGEGVIIAARLEALAAPGGILISGPAFDQVKNKTGHRFEDLGAQTLKNIAEPVRVYRIAETLQPGAPARAPASAVAPNKPSIAVLPFTNMSGNPEQEYFANGLTEDIITALSRVGALWVIARTSTFTYKGKPAEVKRVASELGVRYVIEGSVRRAGDRLRVTAQLIDAETGRHVWAERYDRAVADIFDIQDDITRSVVASTQTQVDLAEGVVTEARPSADFKARDLVARGWAKLYDQTPEAIAEASRLLEEAIQVDPSAPRIHQLRCAVFLNRMFIEEISNNAANVARALELAATALRIAPGDEWAHWLMASALAEAGRLDDAAAACERGLEINPNCSILMAQLGKCLWALGHPQEAIEACQLALRLNPRDPSNFWRHVDIAIAHFVAADYDAALRESKRVVRLRPGNPRAFLLCGIIWAAAAAALEKVDEAQTAVQHCLAQRPDLHVNSARLGFTRDEDRTRLAALLRKAGLPE